VSLKQVLEKKQAGLALVQARREQKQMDEFASQRRPQLSDEYSSGGRS
jgi:flagellar biosynthesis chaperone FliJ